MQSLCPAAHFVYCLSISLEFLFLVTLADVSLARFSRPPKARSREAAAWLDLFFPVGAIFCGGTVASRYLGRNFEKETRDIPVRLYFEDKKKVLGFGGYIFLEIIAFGAFLSLFLLNISYILKRAV